jgi:type IX secretion system PorP/SprF family membrane protein
MKKIFLLLLISFAATAGALAQQEHHYTQWMYNKLYLNPGYAGSRGVPSIMGIYRLQWAGFDGAPRSFLASFNSPFLSPRVGVGVTISNLQIGLQRDFQGSLAYAYDLVGSDLVSVRFGIMGTVRSHSIDLGAARTVEIDNYLQSQGNDAVSDIYANVGAGVYATFANRVYAGFSIPRINSNTLGFSDNNTTMTARESRHMYGMAGAILPLNDDISLMPALLVKYVENAPLDFDINLNLDVREKITAGLSYRPGGDGKGESVDLLIYWQATPQVGIGGAYDFALSSIRDHTAGSFEILAQADLKKKKRSKKMTNPRFFM